MPQGDPDRVYRGDGFSVEWRKSLCVHCGNCVSELPSVFNLDKRPWVTIDGASAKEIKETVSHCPSGALSLGK